MSSPLNRRVATSSSKKVLYAAIAGNLLVAGTKFVAAAWSGSSAMSSEAVHSLVDTGNSVLMLYGLHRGAEPPDREHPLGHGREIYFWSFVVAVLVFALGAGISFLQGIAHVVAPVKIENAEINYIVFALSAVFDGATWYIALRNLNTRTIDVSIFTAIRSSKDPPSFMVLFEDSAALLGLVIAFAGAYLSDQLNFPVLDGIASLLISLVLATTAAFLARETKGLLIGEGADPQIVASILQIANEMEGVDHANGIITVHLFAESNRSRAEPRIRRRNANTRD